MLKIVVFTLFPEMFHGVLGESILARAQNQGLVKIEVVNFRDYAHDRHHTVDDYPFGGGPGMLLKPEPIFEAVESYLSEAENSRARIVLMGAHGRPFTHLVAEEFSQDKVLVLVCGHYEGFDHRVEQHLITEEISLGDFVLTGGEVAAMAVIDATVRLLPGALGNHSSAKDESFASGLLEYPQYTRPASFRGWEVPPTLLSGHHGEIDKWRRRHALFHTWKKRPDLLLKLSLPADELRMIDRWKTGDYSDIDVAE